MIIFGVEQITGSRPALHFNTVQRHDYIHSMETKKIEKRIQL